MEISYSSSDNKTTINRGSSGSVNNFPQALLVIVIGLLSMVIPVVLGLVSKYVLGIEPPSSTSSIVLILIGIFIYSGFILFSLFPRLASWATTKKRIAGITPIALPELQTRLLAINAFDVPFTVQQGSKPNELIATWKVADTKWVGLMFAGGLQFTYKLTMRFDEKSYIARVRETQTTISWDTTGPIPVLKASFHFSFFQGINLLTFNSAQLTGLLFKNGRLSLDNAYKYTFNPDEVKAPVAQIVTQSGWDFTPVVFF
jgi:hypothetical protein